MSQGRIFNRLVRPSRVAAAAKYLFWLSNSLAPLVGSVASDSGITVSGGLLNVTAASNATVAANIVFNDTTQLVVASESLLFAFRLTCALPMIAVSLKLNENATGSHGLRLAGEGTFVPAAYFPAQTAQYQGKGGSVLSAPSTALENRAGEYDMVLAYDAKIGKLYQFVDGVLAQQTAGGYVAVTNFIPNRLLISITEGGENPSATLSLRDLHGIKYSAGLPSNLATLAAEYHANPLASLSSWAV